MTEQGDRLGLMHIYCGDGKGKTTAALGLAVRAAGSGLPVLLVQFLKSQETSELAALAHIPLIRILRGKGGDRFSFAMDEEQKAQTRRVHDGNLRQAIAAAQQGECALLILDESIGAYNRDLLDRQMLLDFVRNKPAQVELVLTGKNPPPELVDCADYVSEVRKIKHPYELGVPARRGIER